MDQNTKDAITHIVEAQAAIIRALHLIANMPQEHQPEGVKPLVENAITHLEETMKAVKNG
ncbi:hypothetical protein [Nitrosomonas sp. Nm166]|uniref:hypothetical protein n=1 Tax=Nitrosomonas sp. Nm166 TaxID=1881054 RepID=UPI0008F16C03|nr:hypothetical protein [Nitrosomonas sp. Nm166]SFF26441.1 hypothetical protein SAMN05428977_10934 [Nitrosomonas sp. Nm166]